MANPANFNNFWRTYPHTILQSFRQTAGSLKMVGNSEIGHSSIGAGRIVFQDLERITEAITDKSFYKNPAFIGAIENAQTYNSSLHLVGLVSDGGIHSHIEHLFALLRLAKFHNLEKVYIHFISDGLDTNPTSAIDYLKQLNDEIARTGVGQVATISGRALAMDRDGKFDQISKVVSAMFYGIGVSEEDPEKALALAYRSGYNDQIIPPVVIKKAGFPVGKISDNDSVIFFNFRPDRAKELTLALTGFQKLPTRNQIPKGLYFVTMTSYNFPNSIQKSIYTAFPNKVLNDTIGDLLANNNLNQFRIAESEKQPHITEFFDCGKTEVHKNEDRVIIDSNGDKTDSAMKAVEITKRLITAIKSENFPFLLANFANVDSIGHTGDLKKTADAVSVVDICLGQIWEAVKAVDGWLIITADHGNAEEMIQSKSIDRETFHSLSPVPFILLKSGIEKKTNNLIKQDQIISQIIASKHNLADVAPTIIEILNIEKPGSWTGKSLLTELNGGNNV